MNAICRSLVWIVCLVAGGSAVAGDEPPVWIWGTGQRAPNQSFVLQRDFEIADDPRQTWLLADGDFCHTAVYVNETRIGSREPFDPPLRVDVSRWIRRGENRLQVRCESVEGPAAVALRLTWKTPEGRRRTIVSDQRWRVSRAGEGAPVATFGRAARFPTSNAANPVAIEPDDDYTQWKRAIDAEEGTDPATFDVVEGFEIRRLRSAREGEDSWVSMAFDPQGRLVIGKEKLGLLRLSLPPSAEGGVEVETINDTLAECRGLVFAHGALYAMANEDRGLFRLRDTDGDGSLEDVERLARFEGDSGHGRNQLTLGPDGRIYGIFGDSVFEPKDATGLPSRPARETDVEQTRSGFLASCSPKGGDWRVHVRGLRNPFGVGFNPDGQAFTYDADAEYDMGSSWYRPTRIVHLVEGADFGWRRVTRRWPPYFPDRPDMPPPTLDIGKGSPTAVAFGTESHFPHPYRRALFVLDWAYGRILAVHLWPRGSSYAARAETFLRGQPLNVTDLEFGPDGNMYFVTGGRGTQSALYRVAYVGGESQEPERTVQQQARAAHAQKARKLRERLAKRLAGDAGPKLDDVWPHLDSSDPWIRLTARSVVEWTPSKGWQERALVERRTEASLAAMMALVRAGPASAREAVVQRLNELDWNALTPSQMLEALFCYERCLGPEGDSGGWSNPLAESVRSRLDPLVPDDSPRVNGPLSWFLARLEAPNLPGRLMTLYEDATTQEDRLHYLFALRHVRDDWTEDLRRRYFIALRQMEDFVGGEGMPTFRRLVREEALASVPTAERDEFAELLRNQDAERWLEEALSPRPQVAEWTLDDLAPLLSQVGKDRDLERGRRMFVAARCIVCHRKEGRGGVSGPELDSLARRFTGRDLLVSILDPSKVVSEKYRNQTFILDDGRAIVGRVAPGDYRSPTLRVVPDLLRPDEILALPKQSIERREPSPVSPMPKGLLNTLTREEALDLLAYVLSTEGRLKDSSVGGR